MTGALDGVDFVRVLGPVQVVLSSGRIVELPSASQRRLLAVLALHARSSVRAEWLADTLGVSPGALRTTVSRLRKVLGDTAVQTTSTGYRLDVDVDAEMFCREIADAAVRIEGAAALEAGAGALGGHARAGEFAERGMGGGRGGASHRVARVGDRGSGGGVDRGVTVAGRGRAPRSARHGVLRSATARAVC